MIRNLITLVLLSTSFTSHATDPGSEADGRDIVRTGLMALEQNLRGVTASAGLGGYPTLIGFGTWLKVYQAWEAADRADGRTEDGTVDDFVREATDLIDHGLTLAQLFRRAYPNAKSDLTPERMVLLALAPFGNQLSDLHRPIDRWAKSVRWVNVGDTCAPEMSAGPSSRSGSDPRG